MKRFLSVCSGIEAASVAWEPLGWRAAGFAEIDKNASRLLAHRYGSNMPGEPLATNGVPNFGDFTTIDVSAFGQIDVLVGGTPCQAFSFAGKRRSLADARGNLSLAYAVLAHELNRAAGLRWAVWENVPGVLNTDDNAFGCFLGGIVGADDALPVPRGFNGWPSVGMVAGRGVRATWRVLDSQYFGVAQRRRRVLLVVGFGDAADPASVLFERKGLRRNPPARGEAGAGSTAAIATSVALRGRDGGGAIELGDDSAFTLRASGGGSDKAHVLAKTLMAGGHSNNPLDENIIAHTLRGEGFDASEDGTGRGTPIVPVCFDPRQSDVLIHGDITGPLDTQFPAIAFDTTQITSRENRSNPQPGDPCHPLAAHAHPPAIALSVCVEASPTHAVRRLTPTECERLQAFPDGYTAIPGAADGPRYKQLGNSMTTNVMRWVGERIEAAEAAKLTPV